MERISRSIERAAIMAALLIATVTLWSCGSREPQGNDAGSSSVEGAPVIEAAGRMRLQNGYGSAAELADAALAAFAANDTARLMKLLVSREEFDRYIYPELGMRYPAARDTGALAREFVWENQILGALKGMKKALRKLGGMKMTLLSVAFKEETERYGSYMVHRGTEVRVKLDDGSEADLPGLGSVVEMDGVFKLMSYRDRE